MLGQCCERCVEEKRGVRGGARRSLRRQCAVCGGGAEGLGACMAGGMPWRGAEEAGGCGGRRRCVHVRRAAVGPRLECMDECSPSSVHFSAEKVVTMLQKRNQVFERVFCADVQVATPRTAAAAPAAAPVQAPRWNLESLLPRGLYCTRRASRAATCACTCGLPVVG